MQERVDLTKYIYRSASLPVFYKHSLSTVPLPGCFKLESQFIELWPRSLLGYLARKRDPA